MPVRIVIVDDHAILREGLRLRLLQEPDIEVVGDAAEATAAYDAVVRHSPDLVIMDLNLPGESGLLAAGRIHKTWPKIKILVLTGEMTDAAAHDALLAGAAGFLRKEEAGTELIRAIRIVMSGKTYLSPDAATVVTQALLAHEAPTMPALSEREIAVLRGLADGLSYKEIADRLGISAKSVETYRARLVKKTQCSTRAELVRFAIRKGISTL
jgi:two-component system response regulator NreC